VQPNDPGVAMGQEITGDMWLNSTSGDIFQYSTTKGWRKVMGEGAA
jgi:hypothetical protein